MTPIQLYTYQTPNGHKVSIMLEETGLPYDVHVIDIEVGEQRTPEFLALNPNNKIPVIVDPDQDRTIFESGAILPYLAERSGVLLPGSDAEKIPYVIGRFEAEANRVYRVLEGRLARYSHIAGEAYGIADVMT